MNCFVGTVAVVAGGLLFGAVAVAAQSAAPAAPPDVERHVNVTVLHGGADDAGMMLALPPTDQLDFLATPLAVGGEPVAGAPYSADAVTEVVQTLADGNRIVRQSKASLYRDGKGRTRREQGLTVLAGLVGGGDARTQIQLHDPEAGTMYLLDPQQRTARRLPAPKVQVSLAGAPERPIETFDFGLTQTAEPGRRLTVIRRREQGDGGRMESLGRKTVEGVDADGTRTTVVIPAGQIGNELPIDIVYERWYSPALKVLVMSRQSDPRYGETTYRLTNLVRAEPAPELFQVPADFRTIDGAADVRKQIRIQRK